MNGVSSSKHETKKFTSTISLSLPKKWQIYQMKELSTLQKDSIQTGPFGSLLHSSDYVENGTPIIQVNNLQNGEIIAEKIPKVKKSDVERLSRYIVKPDDIIFSRVEELEVWQLLKKNILDG